MTRHSHIPRVGSNPTAPSTFMKTCETCEHFSPYNNNFGLCSSGKLLIGEETNNSTRATDTARGGGYDGYGDYIDVGKDFGCIHYEHNNINEGKDI